MILDLPPPKLWLPQRPAIIRPASRDLAPASFPFPVFVPHAAALFGNDAFTKLLIKGGLADGSTTFTDASVGGGGHTVTAAGNVQYDDAELAFSQTMIRFDGSNDTLALDGHADFAFGTGDWAIDFWLVWNATTVTFLVDFRPDGEDGLYPTIYLQSDPAVRYHTNGATRITGTTTLVSGTLYHVAVTRVAGTTRLFINGTQEGSSYTDANDYLVGADRPIFGTSGSSGSGDFNGWQGEIRISKGDGRWSANFTPPTAPYTQDSTTVDAALASAAASVSSTASIIQNLNAAFTAVAADLDATVIANINAAAQLIAAVAGLSATAAVNINIAAQLIASDADLDGFSGEIIRVIANILSRTAPLTGTYTVTVPDSGIRVRIERHSAMRPTIYVERE